MMDIRGRAIKKSRKLVNIENSTYEIIFIHTGKSILHHI